MRRVLLILLLVLTGPAWGHEVDFVPEGMPAVLEIGRWQPATVRVTNRGTSPWPGPGRGAPLVAWEIAEGPDSAPVYHDYAPVGPPLEPGESRQVMLHLGGAVREGRAWLRVRPVLVGDDFPPVQGVRGTAVLPVAMPADASFWTRWRLPGLRALYWGWWAALAVVLACVLRSSRRVERTSRPPSVTPLPVRPGRS